MAQPRLAMRKIRDILRLHLVGGVSSCRQLARAAGCGKSAVADCLRRAAEAGLDRWETIAALDESDLEQRLYPPSVAPVIRKHRPLPDWSRIREELARRDHHVTLALLWTEYKAEHPDGYQYSQFVDLYRRFEKKLSVVLRQYHRAGEKVFVDFCDGIMQDFAHWTHPISSDWTHLAWDTGGAAGDGFYASFLREASFLALTPR